MLLYWQNGGQPVNPIFWDWLSQGEVTSLGPSPMQELADTISSN